MVQSSARADAGSGSYTAGAGVGYDPQGGTGHGGRHHSRDARRARNDRPLSDRRFPAFFPCPAAGPFSCAEDAVLFQPAQAEKCRVISPVSPLLVRSDGSRQLYDAVTDPRQYANLAANPDKPGTLSSLGELLHRRQAEVAAGDGSLSRPAVARV